MGKSIRTIGNIRTIALLHAGESRSLSWLVRFSQRCLCLSFSQLALKLYMPLSVNAHSLIHSINSFIQFNAVSGTQAAGMDLQFP